MKVFMIVNLNKKLFNEGFYFFASAFCSKPSLQPRKNIKSYLVTCKVVKNEEKFSDGTGVFFSL